MASNSKLHRCQFKLFSVTSCFSENNLTYIYYFSLVLCWNIYIIFYKGPVKYEKFLYQIH